jgi:hypothetical protein
MSAGKFTYRNTAGNFVEGEIGLHDYEMAANMGVRTSQVINAKYPDADPQLGTAWEQGKKSVGIYEKDDPRLGIKSPTIRDVMNGECMRQGGLLQMAGGTIVAPSVPVGNSTPASRVFLPETILEMVEENLQEDFGPEMALFERLIADSLSIAGPIYTQPVINTEEPGLHDARPIVQNSLPRNLVSITASQSSRTVPVESFGLQIADQAAQLASISLVNTIISKQMEGARKRMLWRDLSALVSGNIDAGESALTPVGVNTFDSSAGSGKLTQKAMLKMLYQPNRVHQYNAVLCTLDDYMAIQNREGRPLMFDPNTASANTGNSGTYGLDVTISSPANFAQLGVPMVFIVPDGLWAANQLLFLDTRYALRRVTNALASYTASEQLILQRSSFLRFDVGMIIHRLYDDAFMLVDYS